MDILLEWLNLERGRSKTLAEILGISPPAISQWKRVPADKVIDVEAATGISRHKLRPDVFGGSA